MRGSRNKFHGEGVQAWRQENSLDNCFLVFNLFYSLQRGSNGFITEKTYFSKDPELVQHFPGGGGSNFSEGGGVQLLISMETHITCDFTGRVWTTFPSGSAHGTNTCTAQEAGTVYPGNEAS